MLSLLGLLLINFSILRILLLYLFFSLARSRSTSMVFDHTVNRSALLLINQRFQQIVPY